MNILIAGGAGYVGSHACKQLADAGHTVLVLDNLSTGHREAVQFGELVVGSIEDSATVSNLLASRRIDAVMHFAASSLVGESVTDPYAYYYNNTACTLALLRVMHSIGVKTFIFSSTAAVYGEPQSSVMDETHPRLPINPYGRSKLATELILEDAAQAYGLHAVTLRYFNAAGADESGCIGESHDPETHLIPKLLRKAAGEAIEISIFGTDYPTADGTCIRDYVHVSDLADAHLRALEYTHSRPGFHAFNLGTGTGTTVRDVIQTAERVTGMDLQIPVSSRRAGDPTTLVASNQKATRELGWSPSKSSIERIMTDAWRWHRQRRTWSTTSPLATPSRSRA